MSYSEFKKELDLELNRLGDDFGSPIDLVLLRERMNQAAQIVFDRWMNAGKQRDLVEWLIKNFDSGGGDEFVNPLSRSLLTIGDREALRKLMRNVICTRENSFWNWSQMPSAEGANEQITSLESETYRAFELYIAILQELGSDRELEELKEAFNRFKSRKSKLKRKLS